MKAMFPLLLAVLLGACRDTAETPAADAGAPSAPALALPPVQSSNEPAQLLPSDRIYYDLTRFTWYARGEPLRHDGRSYQPGGMPVAAPLDEMELAGAYEGVEYYRHRDSGALLYVPVYDGYWLAFRASAASPVPAD